MGRPRRGGRGRCRRARLRTLDDGRYVILGALKGNVGSSNYPIPPDVDLAALPSVSIWCARFHVSFAAARLDPAA